MTDRPAWQYDEFQHVGTDYGSIEEVRVYDERMRTLRDIPREVEGVLDALDLKPESTLIEIGAGTGELAIRAARRCAKVYALDVSQVMLDYAQQKAASRGVTNIEFIRAGFLSYQHMDAPVDAVVSQLALHHLPDFWKAIALKRIGEMLKVGGRFYLRDIVFPSGVDDYSVPFESWIAGLEASVGGRIAEDVTRHIREEYSTLDWIMVGLLRSAGLTVSTADYTAGMMAVYLCRRVHGS